MNENVTTTKRKHPVETLQVITEGKYAVQIEVCEILTSTNLCFGVLLRSLFNTFNNVCSVKCY